MAIRARRCRDGWRKQHQLLPGWHMACNQGGHIWEPVDTTDASIDYVLKMIVLFLIMQHHDHLASSIDSITGVYKHI